MTETESFLSSKEVVAIIILIIYTITTPILNKFHFHYVHESGICMLLGLITGFVAQCIYPDHNFAASFNFDDELFFNFVLPPIIFAAGYNLKKKSFFRYLFYIVTFGIFGTLVAFGTVVLFTYVFNYIGAFNTQLSIKEILLFASVIAATDTVAALTFINDEDQPKLFAVLFGEGVLNDAVCIVLYRIIKSSSFGAGDEFNGWVLLSIAGAFMVMFTVSTLLGVIGGCLCSYTLKLLKPCKLNRIQETSLIIFFAFLTYSCTELMGYSPIISLLFCGIIMSHYAFYNLSFQSREESCIVSKIMSNIAEGFIFTYLGLTSITISHESLSITVILCMLIFVLLGRLFAVYGVSLLFKVVCSKMFQFSFNEQGITFSAGCIRGAIAFGLALSMPNEKNKPLLISTTLVLVFFTTVLFGALMSSIVKFFSGTNKKRVAKEVFQLGQELERVTLAQMEVSKEKSSEKKKPEDPNKPQTATKQIRSMWKRIDEKYIRPFLIDDWPDVKDEHQIIGRGR